MKERARGRGHSPCKGPGAGAGAGLMYSRSREKASVSGVECARGQVVGDGVSGNMGEGGGL